MSVAEILEQAKTLSEAELNELIEELQEMRHKPAQAEPVQKEEHWGKISIAFWMRLDPLNLFIPKLKTL